MSNTKLQAVDDIRKLARSLKGLVSFADELERIGSVENAAKEADARLEKAQAAEAAADKDLAVALEDVKKAKEAASQLLVDARKLADQSVEIGKKAGAEIVAKANRDADGIMQGALARHSKLDEDSKRIEGYIKDLDKQIAEKSAIVNDLDTKIQAIRKQVGG